MRALKYKNIILQLILIGVVVLLGAIPVSASTLNMDLDTAFVSGTTPGGTSPWLTATFEDGAAVDTVTLTMTAGNLVEREKVGGWYFNFDSSLDLNSLTFNYEKSLSTGAWAKVDTGEDAFKADGDGYYDILFSFPTNKKNFSAGETVVYTISGSNIDASSFEFFSAPGGGHGTYLSAAHVQSISGIDSAWIGAGGTAPVPEPATMVLFGFGLIGLAGIGRRQMKRSA